jgi:hypothetical protein
MVHPLVSARIAALLHPIGAVILGLTGPGAITAFAVLHGAGNGLLTIAKGTVPLAGIDDKVGSRLPADDDFLGRGLIGRLGLGELIATESPATNTEDGYRAAPAIELEFTVDFPPPALPNTAAFLMLPRPMPIGGAANNHICYRR